METVTIPVLRRALLTAVSPPVEVRVIQEPEILGGATVFMTASGAIGTVISSFLK